VTETARARAAASWEARGEGPEGLLLPTASARPAQAAARRPSARAAPGPRRGKESPSGDKPCPSHANLPSASPCARFTGLKTQRTNPWTSHPDLAPLHGVVPTVPTLCPVPLLHVRCPNAPPVPTALCESHRGGQTSSSREKLRCNKRCCSPVLKEHRGAGLTHPCQPQHSWRG